MTLLRLLPVLALLTPVVRAETIAQLKEREAKVRAVVEKVMPSVVAITSADKSKPGSGSGVIVQKDGLILTAAHVTAATGEEINIIFPDGRTVKGKSLGANRGTDAGLAKITDEGQWPAVEMGSSDKMLFGDWCVAMGHPGGFDYSRRPPVRLGRIWRRDVDGAIFTNNPLIGGDSGGPLFDLEGRVIGINSSIHGAVDANRHVAIDTLRDDWDRMMTEKAWGRQVFGASNDRPVFGAKCDPDSQAGVKIIEAPDEDSPAGKAGLKDGDVITRFDGTDLATWHHLNRLIGKKKPHDKVKVAVRRGSEAVECEIELGESRRSRVANNDRPKDEDKPEEDQPSEPRDEDKPKKDRVPEPPKVVEESGPRPYFGAALEDTDGKGAKVTEVKANSPAAKAGLTPGDIIIRLNDKEVAGLLSAAEVIRALKPGDTLAIKAKRGETDFNGDATLEKK